MASDRTPRVLGAALLLQAVASVVSGLLLLQPLIVPGNIVDSMTNIANHALQPRASIVVEMITAKGIAKFGSLLFVTLRVQNQNMALVVLGLYLFFRSGFLPRVLSLWGLIAAPLALVGTLYALLGHDVPIVVFIPKPAVRIGNGSMACRQGYRGWFRGKVAFGATPG